MIFLINYFKKILVYFLMDNNQNIELEKEIIEQIILWLSVFIRTTYNGEDAIKVNYLRTILEDKLYN